MSKGDIGAGLGVAAIMAVCCAGPFLLLAVVGSGLAILTGQTVLIAAAILTLGAIGMYVWRRRSNQCRTEICSPQVERSPARSQTKDPIQSAALPEREPVAAGREDGR